MCLGPGTNNKYIFKKNKTASHTHSRTLLCPSADGGSRHPDLLPTSGIQHSGFSMLRLTLEAFSNIYVLWLLAAPRRPQSLLGQKHSGEKSRVSSRTRSSGSGTAGKAGSTASTPHTSVLVSMISHISAHYFDILFSTVTQYALIKTQHIGILTADQFYTSWRL